MEAGSLLSFVIYTVMIGGAIAGLGSLYTTIAGALGATERVKEILYRPVEVAINDQSDTKTKKEIHGDVIFDRVKFTYPSRPDSVILDGINIKIEKGQKVAIVGQSGGGKSTLIKLLMRFYDVQEGSISVDGTDIRDFDLTTFRTAIGLVPQEIILFGGSIRENLLYGNSEASEDEIIEAAKKANCWEFISTFQEGLDTVVGERGVKLSGGQKQRVAIARTILKDPKILLLDEATSSLDAGSEKVVQDAINNLMQDRTAIIVAHRLATIRDVDKIYVLEDGQVAESGSHDELIQKDQGIYKNLANLQFNLKAS
jgi:ABC-type multidrug transport system fused ATPase/permease subunit